MDLQLKNKVIIVTGGASGIGAAICKTLAEEGAIPCILDLREGDGFSIVVELTDPVACRRAVEEVMKRWGRIDGVVNNAGLNDGVGLETGGEEGFVRSLERNAGHYYQVAHSALSALEDSRGCIVNIISKVAFTGQGNTSGYAAANGVRAELTQEWALELASRGIRVNGVVVAECWTPAYEKWISGLQNGTEQLKEIEAMVPLENRLTKPKEIADTVVFLLSPLSQGVKGELVHVDGGYVHLDRRAGG
ncbi:MAG TPA: SDR family oxidoreductase [Puia sp.]|jgi:L-fucose dehydrogenase